MNEQEVLEVLGRVGAIIPDSHMVYTSGKHGTAYINKDALYPYTVETSRLCRAIAERFAYDDVEVVIAPAIGGVILSQWTAHHITEMNNREVLGIYAEKSALVKEKQITPNTTEITLTTRDDNFRILRGYDKLVAGKRVLVVEDVLTTGGSAKRVIEATRAIGGNVVGLGVLWNRGGVTPQDVADVPKLTALVNVKFDTYDEATCPLCEQGIPINTDVGQRARGSRPPSLRQA